MQVVISLWSKSYTCTVLKSCVTCKHYLIHVMYMHKVYHVHNYIIIIHILAPKELKSAPYK